jgi:hypothetical protein
MIRRIRMAAIPENQNSLVGAFGTQPEPGLPYCRYGLEACLRLTADAFARLLGVIHTLIDRPALVTRDDERIPGAGGWEASPYIHSLTYPMRK